MPTSPKADGDEILSVTVDASPVEDLLTKEWLLTNEHGGYASSTIIGCNTRRYHGLLIGSLSRLASRIMGLANCQEMVILNESGRFCNKSQNGSRRKVFNLSTFEFSGKLAPEGFRYLKRFRQDIGVHFDYQLDKVELTKSVYLLRDADTVAVVYDFANVGDIVSQEGGVGERSVEFVLRPFVGLRDFHSLQKSYARLCWDGVGDGLLIRHDAPGSCGLLLSCSSMSFRKDQQWWFNFVYRNDKERGQDFTEDLWSPGFFKCGLGPAGKTDKRPCTKRIVLWASLRAPVLQARGEKTKEMGSGVKGGWAGLELNTDIEAVYRSLQRHQEGIRVKARRGMQNGERRYELLCLAADQFIAKRQTRAGAEEEEGRLQARHGKHRTTVLAGFPWFADWGRDAFISLPGLLLLTGRFEEAKSVLVTFAGAVDEGMIPNRFDEYGDTAYFNSIDASLWFISAAFQYLYATEDSGTFTRQLLPAICWITDSYQKGTRFGIGADVDGLIMGGNDETQLTWMDAKYDGTAFTPRYGKAVEINALWYNSLCYLAQFYGGRDGEPAKRYKSMSEKVAASFCKLFWNDSAGYLNDCVLPGGCVDASLRPNQIFAVSLAFSPLSSQQQKRVVDVVEKHLLTPYGLRTLKTDDGRYRGRYSGPQGERDEAYHQGTVWPYLIGPFVEAYLKVNDFSRKSKRKAAEFIEPLMQHLTEDGCLGQVCEIFDGDDPHKPKGCIAQAWSVAELIRAYHLINR